MVTKQISATRAGVVVTGMGCYALLVVYTWGHAEIQITSTNLKKMTESVTLPCVFYKQYVLLVTVVPDTASNILMIKCSSCQVIE